VRSADEARRNDDAHGRSAIAQVGEEYLDIVETRRLAGSVLGLRLANLAEKSWRRAARNSAIWAS
jgi:hypothetical protein